MKTKIGKFKLEFFDSIDILPFDRFNAFNKYIMLDSELGSNIGDFDKIANRILEFMDKDMLEQAREEVLNMRIVYNNILTENNSKGLAFACMLKSINGNEVEDFSQDNLIRILNDLSKEGLPIRKVVDTNSEVKKK